MVGISPTGVSPSVPGLPRPFGYTDFPLCGSSTPGVRRLPVWALPFSLAATGGISFDYFSSGYLDVSVRRVCPPCGWYDVTRTGLPHSEIRVSMPTCGSARLFAAYRVLHRLSTPRHPPYALHNLTNTLINFPPYCVNLRMPSSAYRKYACGCILQISLSGEKFPRFVQCLYRTPNKYELSP